MDKTNVFCVHRLIFVHIRSQSPYCLTSGVEYLLFYLSFQIRNGPGQFEAGRRHFGCPLDGFAKVSSWRFTGNGSAFFSTKFVKSQFYTTSMKENDISPAILFGPTQPKFSRVQLWAALLKHIDNMNVNIYRFSSAETRTSGDFVILTDIWGLYRIHPISLDTLGYQYPTVPSTGGINSFVFRNFLSTAHPLPEYGTSHHFTYLFSLSVIPGVKHRISLIRIKSTNEREVVAQWQVNKPPFMHSFSVTPNYVIFFRPPAFFDMKQFLLFGFLSKALEWKGAEMNTTIWVIGIKSGNVKTYSVPAMYFMHHINAFETGNNEIIVDIAIYKDPDIILNYKMDIFLNSTKRDQLNPHATLTRYGIGLNRTEVSMKTFPESKKYPCTTKFDLPIINENYRSRPYCFAYGVVPKWDNQHYGHFALVKKDLCGTGRDDMWYVPNHYPAEVWFVPLPAEKLPKEDEGYLMVPVLDGEKNSSYLAIIDAVSMTTISTAYLPTKVPETFHGRFFPGTF